MAARKSAASKQATTTDDAGEKSAKKKGAKNRAAELQAALGKGDHESVSWAAMRQLHDDAGGSIEETPEGKAAAGMPPL